MTGTPAERSAREELRRRQEAMIRVVLRPIGSPLAMYAAWAFELEDVNKQTVLPTL